MNYISNNYVFHTWMKWFRTSNTGNCRFCMCSISYNAFYVIDNKFPSCENCYKKKNNMPFADFIKYYKLCDPMDID